MSSTIETIFRASLLIVILGIIVYFVRKRRRFVAIIDRIPGPTGHPIIGIVRQLPTRRESMSRVFKSLYTPFFDKSPIIKAWLGPIPVVAILKAEAAKVLLNNNVQIDKGVHYNYLHNWIGDGLLLSTGSKWQSRRKLITPSFHFRILENFLIVMNEKADILVRILDKQYQQVKSEEFDICPFVTRCTLDIICETAMGQGVDAQLSSDSEYVNAVLKLSEVVSARMFKPWLALDWIYHLTAEWKIERHSLQILHEFTDNIIKMKRAKLQHSHLPKIHKDEVDEDNLIGRKRRVAMLDMLLEKAMEDASNENQALTDEDIREEVDTFMFEGHDTTSVGISWALYCIGQNDEVQQKIVNELDAVFGDSDRDCTSADLHNLKYLECVIKESLRLFPSVPMIARIMRDDIDICGYTIPSGITVIISQYAIHRDPVYFPNPETFDPDRFLPVNCKDRDPFAYIPFSAGPRNCIGQKFAMMEEKVVLSRILRRFQLTTVVEEDLDSNMIGELVLRPIRGVRVKLETRMCNKISV